MSGSRTAAVSPPSSSFSSNDDSGCNSDEEPLMLDKVEDREAQADDTRLISAPHFWLWFEHRLQKKYYRDIDKLLVYVKPPLVVFKEIKILIQEIGSLVSPLAVMISVLRCNSYVLMHKSCHRSRVIRAVESMAKHQ